MKPLTLALLLALAAAWFLAGWTLREAWGSPAQPAWVLGPAMEAATQNSVALLDLLAICEAESHWRTNLPPRKPGDRDGEGVCQMTEGTAAVVGCDFRWLRWHAAYALECAAREIARAYRYCGRRDVGCVANFYNAGLVCRRCKTEHTARVWRARREWIVELSKRRTLTLARRG